MSMGDEYKLAYITGQVAIFNCRLAAMQAENQFHQLAGQTPTYKESDFRALEAEFSQISHNAVIDFFRD